MEGDSWTTRPSRRTTDLRKGRVSVPGATYFVTFATAGRKPWLTGDAAFAAGKDCCEQAVADGDVAWLCSTTMPDHVHLLFQLGSRHALGRVIGKWRAAMRRQLPGLSWQENFFDHRLRPADGVDDYAWYMFMNPYRAGLVPIDSVWPGWWGSEANRLDFLEGARPGPCPQPEWLDAWETRAAGLATGENEPATRQRAPYESA